MRWPWTRKAATRTELRDSRAAVADALATQDEAHQIVERVVKTVQRNHFGENIHRALRGS